MHPVRYQEIGNRAAAALLKYPVLNHAVLRELRRLRAGRWQKVIKCGNIGEVHYFEHRSGRVAGVKFYSRPVTQ